MNRERPIIFSAPMVRAILGNRKTQTRRVVKNRENPGQCPYGEPGDLLWVRETFREFDDGDVFYKEHFGNSIPVHANDEPDDWKWTPSIYMPRRLSRITLEIINIRTELLQEISEADARAEGALKHLPVSRITGEPCYTSGFRKIWIAIHEIDTHKLWYANPLVWVIEFKRR